MAECIYYNLVTENFMIINPFTESIIYDIVENTSYIIYLGEL